MRDERMTKRLSRIIDGEHARRDALHRIVVVGDGAAGLELVTHLGERFGRRWGTLVTLVASGSIDPADHEVSDLAQAGRRGFRSLCGEMIGLNRAARTVYLAATRDGRGRQVTPLRSFGYDTLVLAVGAQEVLERLDGLEIDRSSQLLVGPTLQTTRDRDIFAIGDCEQAAHMLRQIDHRFRGKPLAAYVYRNSGRRWSGEFAVSRPLLLSFRAAASLARSLLDWMRSFFSGDVFNA